MNLPRSASEQLISKALSLLDYLRPYLNHSFQNVRERLGSILINIFEADLCFAGGSKPECPRIKDIIAEVVQTVQILHQEMPKILPKGAKMVFSLRSDLLSAFLSEATVSNSDTIATTDSEYDKAVRLFKTSKFKSTIE